MRDFPCREAAFDLRREIVTRRARPVLLEISEVILVRRPKQRAGNLATPWRGVIADACPNPAGSEAIAAAVERIGMRAREQVETVELIPAGQSERRESDFDIGGGVPASAQAA